MSWRVARPFSTFLFKAASKLLTERLSVCIYTDRRSVNVARFSAKVLPMTQEKKRIRTQFCEIAYTERGEGPVALFVHGVFPNSYLWRHVVARVADLRRGIAVDLMSHGDNPAGEPPDISFGAQ